MKLKDQILIKQKIIIPKLLKSKINVMANCKLTDREVSIFNACLKCVENHLIKDNIYLSKFFAINVLFSKDGGFSFYENNEDRNAFILYIAIYNMEKLRICNADWLTAFSYVEELTHYFWNIQDENDVKYKVAEILQDIFPALSIDIMKGLGIEWS